MNNLYNTKPKSGETPEDEALLLRVVLDYRGKGNRITFVGSMSRSPADARGIPGYFCNFHHKEGHVFASEHGVTRREALEKTIAVVVASQLEGAKVTNEPPMPGVFDDLPRDSYF